MRKTMISAAVLSLMAAPLSHAAPASGGGNAGGQPFVLLQDQIIQVQNYVTTTIEQQITNLTTTVINTDSALADRVASLEGRVTSLEDRVAITEQNIGSLQMTAGNLQSQIDALVATAASQGVDILGLQAQLAAANSQIETLLATSGDHTAEIAALQATADGLRNQIETNASGITALQTKLGETNTLITGLQTQLNQLKAGLALKQDIVNHKCPGGQVLVEARSDGSVVCTPASVTNVTNNTYNNIDNSTYPTTGIQSVTTYTVWLAAYHRYGGTINLYCPAGSIATGGGYWRHYGQLPHWSGPLNGPAGGIVANETQTDINLDGWALVFGGETHMIGVARCLKFNTQ